MVFSVCLLQVHGFSITIVVYHLLQPCALMLSVRHKLAILINDSLNALKLPSLLMPLFKLVVHE